MTMKSQLQALQCQDPGSIFIARRINRLGFSSPEQLRAHFRRFGEVAAVHVAHSLVKSARQPGAAHGGEAHRRQRPAALGFVVMSSCEAAQLILAEGPEHTVNGVKITVQAFHRHDDALDAEADEPDHGQAATEVAAHRDPAPGAGRGQGGGPSPAAAVGAASPLCPLCGSTVAVHLGVGSCQVCKRWWAHAGSWWDHRALAC